MISEFLPFFYGVLGVIVFVLLLTSIMERISAGQKRLDAVVALLNRVVDVPLSQWIYLIKSDLLSMSLTAAAADENAEVWQEFIVAGCCGLCHGNGYVELLEKSAEGHMVARGRFAYCICPKGREMKEKQVDLRGNYWKCFCDPLPPPPQEMPDESYGSTRP